MLVLHALWNNSDQPGLQLWAEDATLAGAVLEKNRGRDRSGGRPAKVRKILPHPFSLSGGALLEAVSELWGSVLVEPAEFGAISLLLPSNTKIPLPSPQLILEEPIEQRATELVPWEIPTLSFEADQALDLLLALPEQIPHQLVLGNSLCYWVEAARFTLELAARQRFVPTVKTAKTNGKMGYQAVWEINLEPEERNRLQILAKAMPPLCRAFLPDHQKANLATTSKTAPPQPLQLLTSFLNHTLDAFVRGSLAKTPLLPRRLRRATQPLTEQWLHALASPDDPTLAGSVQELKSFAQQVQGWLAQLQPVGDKTPFRTCFRLDPPPETGTQGADSDEVFEFEEARMRQPKPQPKSWRLGFFLQANDDPSLLVEASQVWRARSGTLSLLKRQFENPQERLLADLGKASRLFPPLEDSLKTARPVELELDTAQTYEFLRQGAPLLEQSGFGVLLPSWWSKPTAKLGVKLHVKPKKGESKTALGLLGLDGIVAYDWQIALGEETISAQEFAKLASLKVPLVKIRGKWVELKPEDMEAALAFFQKQHLELEGEMSLGQALRLGLGEMGQESSILGLPVLKLETEGWIKELLNKLGDNTRLSPVEPPPAFQGKLRPYQVQGLSWLAFLRQVGFGACLADDMGLGKTAQLIALLLHQRDAALSQSQNQTYQANGTGKSTIPLPSLVICPMSVVGNWHKELARFAPSLKVMVHHGVERLTGEEFQQRAKEHDVVLTTYSLAQRDEATLAQVEWENVVLDEAQNIKNQAAKQTQAIRRLKGRSRIALTGTPVENRLSELWSIMHFLNPGYLGSAQEFRSRFATPIERYKDPAKAKTLKSLIQPFVLRRLKTDKQIIADLPEKLEMKVFCNLTREQATLYEAVVKEMLTQIENSEGIQRKGLVLSTLLKLKQICNHPAQFVHDNSTLPSRSGKLNRLEEMLEEVLAEGDKALIFTQFSEMGGMLRSYLQQTLGREVLYLHGGTPKAQRDLMVQRFQQQDRHSPPLFILSLKAGGVGLNLTGANHVFHFDRWWNPAVENQATDRAFRIGQLKNVQVHKFICVGTLEERIDQMIEHKKELAEAVVSAGENWLTELSTDQLKDLFALSQDAVGE